MAVTGDLIATESGVDTFLAYFTDGILRDSEGEFIRDEYNNLIYDGYVTVIGAVFVTETGIDTFAATGTVSRITGYVNVTETGIDTFATIGYLGGTGSLAVTGSLNATETGVDTFVATGIVTSVPVVTPSATSTLPKYAIYTMDSLTSKKTRTITETVFLDRENVICLQLFADELPADLSSVTSVTLVNLDSDLDISSITYPNVFDWTLGDGKISIDLADLDISPGEYYFYLVLYDVDNPLGLVWEVFSVNFMITYN